MTVVNWKLATFLLENFAVLIRKVLRVLWSLQTVALHYVSQETSKDPKPFSDARFRKFIDPQFHSLRLC
jgi:hypothetical protein